MKRTNVSFRTLYYRSFLHRLFFYKKTNTGCSGKRLHFGKTAAAITVAVNVVMTASAQCNTFQNADAANPLLAVFPKNKTVAGFAFADIDGDGDLDVYVDFSGEAKAKNDVLHLYRNAGTKWHPVFTADSVSGFGTQRAGGQNGEMQFVDIDGDGDLDFFASDSSRNYYGGGNIYFYKNIGTPNIPEFVASVASSLPNTLGTHHIQPFTFADVDGDGDYDLYTADVRPDLLVSYYQRVHFNMGTPQQPFFADTYTSAEDDGALYRTYYDWNRNGLPDYFDISAFAPIQIFDYYRNAGPKDQPSYIQANGEAPSFTNGYPYRMIDLNSDGAPEVYDFAGHYSTLSPVAIIEDTLVCKGNNPVQVLKSKNQNTGYLYRWEYNGKLITGASNYYLVPQKTGTYTLYVTSNCGTGVSLNYEFKKASSQLIALDKLIGDSRNTMIVPGLNIYPNPFADAVTLQLPGGRCTVKILDVTDKVMFNQTTSDKTLQTGHNLMRGFYGLQIWQDDKKILSAQLEKL